MDQFRQTAAALVIGCQKFAKRFLGARLFGGGTRRRLITVIIHHVKFKRTIMGKGLRIFLALQAQVVCCQRELSFQFLEIGIKFDIARFGNFNSRSIGFENVIEYAFIERIFHRLHGEFGLGAGLLAFFQFRRHTYFPVPKPFRSAQRTRQKNVPKNLACRCVLLCVVTGE